MMQRAGIRYRNFRDALFLEFKQIQLALLQTAVNTQVAEPMLIMAYSSEVAGDLAHACYSYEEDRIIAITCMHWPHDSILPVQCCITIPALFTKIWQTPAPARLRLGKRLQWHLTIRKAKSLHNLGTKLNMCPIRYHIFSFTNYKGQKFDSYHYLN